MAETYIYNPELNELNIKCMNIIQEMLLTPDVACQISYKLCEDDHRSHNCLGCQLNDLFEEIKSNFSKMNVEELGSTFYTKTYLFWIYFVVEIMFETLDFLNVKFENLDLKKKKYGKYPSCVIIKRWVNFFKHPKASKFTHHPQYLIYSENRNQTFEKNVFIVDQEFVYKFYEKGGKNEELDKLLINNEKVLIYLPNLVELTSGLCNDFINFVSFILSNDDIVHYLKSISTIEYNNSPNTDLDPNYVPPEALEAQENKRKRLESEESNE